MYTIFYIRKMKKYLIITLLLFFKAYAYAQSEEPRAYLVDDNYNLWGKSIGDEGIVFADIAYIRDYPGTNGKVIDSLTNGDKIRILSEGYNPSKIRGFTAPWHKVEYKNKQGQKKEGYIWLGLLALGKVSKANEAQFIFGILKHNKETSYSAANDLIEVKVFDQAGTLLDRAYYPAELDGQSFTDSKLLSNMGLDNLESIYRIGFLGEACGIASNHYYFGWNGTTLTPMFYKSSVSDAGVYYYDEKILFPSEHKLDKNLILKDIEIGEVVDEDAEEPVFKTTKQRKKYHWDGHRIFEVLELK